MAVCDNLITCIYASTWVGLIMFFIVPFEIYITIKFYKYRFHPGIQTRYPMVIIAASIFAMIHSFVCEIFYYLQSGININILNIPSVIFASHIIFPPFLLIMFNIVALRVYLIHYNTMYAVSQATLDWQSLLSDSVPSVDFYSKNRATYGNWRYVIKYFIIYGIIGSGIEITVTTLEHPKLLNISHDVSKYIYALCLFPMIVFSACMYCKTPKFDDIYFVRKELKYLTVLVFICIILYIISSALNSDTYPIFAEVAITAITLANFGQVMISEYIILNKIRTEDDSGYSYDKSTFMLTRVSRVLSNASQRRAKFIAPATLFNVLVATPAGCDLLVKHLRSEFCCENLLSFIELIQWIYLATNKEFDKFNIKPLDKIEFDLCSIIPISSANHCKNNTNQWKWEDSIILIYQKYINSSAELQVNLPYQTQLIWGNLIYSLKIKQELDNKTYIFKHKPAPIKKPSNGSLINRLSFSIWGKSTNKSSKKILGISMLTIPENKDVNVENETNGTVDISKSISKSSIRKHISFKSSKSKTKSTQSTKNTQNINSELNKFTETTSLASELNKFTTTSEFEGSHTGQIILEDVDQLVMLDDDYKLYGGNYPDPEISKTDPDVQKTDTNRTVSFRTNSNRTGSVRKNSTNRTGSYRMNTMNSTNRTVSFKLDFNIDESNKNNNLKVPEHPKLKNEGSIIQSVKNIFSKIGRTSSRSKSIKKQKSDTNVIDEEKINNLYIKEWEQVEKAKKK
eukprot:6700_1